MTGSRHKNQKRLKRQFSTNALLLSVVCGASLVPLRSLADEVTVESVSVIELDSGSIENDSVSTYVIPHQIVESELIEEVTPQAASLAATEILAKPNNQELPAAEEIQGHKNNIQTNIAATHHLYSEDVPVEALMRSRDIYRQLFGDSVIQLENSTDKRFVGSLKSPSAESPLISEGSSEIPDGHEVAPSEALQPDKVYTVADGKVYEVEGKDKPQSNPTQNTNVPANVGGMLVSVIQDEPLAKKPSSGEAKPAAGTFSLLPSSASNSGVSEDAKKASVRGRIHVPENVDPTSVVVRIAGTNWQIAADEDGFFELPELPIGSKFEILVWDTENALTRRLIPVSVGRGENEYNIELRRNAIVDAIAAGFGVRQATAYAGFCAKLTGVEPIALVGAKVSVKADAQGPYFFNSTNLPDVKLKEGTQDGRFCVFNVQASNVSFSVQLLNGLRRTFEVHLQPSVFESDVTVDMRSAVYRPVVAVELSDSEKTMEAISNGRDIRFGTAKEWLIGNDAATWAPTSEFYLTTDPAYASQFVDFENKKDVVFLPNGQEFVEVRWSAHPAMSEAFALVGRDELKTKEMQEAMRSPGAVVRSKTPFSLKVLDGELAKDLNRYADEGGIDPELGIAFVSIDLAGIEANLDDIKLSLKDPWTGESVAKFNMLPYSPGVKNPRVLRGFFANLTPGQYTLLVTNKDGAVKWIDVVRARQGSFQVLSIRE